MAKSLAEALSEAATRRACGFKAEAAGDRAPHPLTMTDAEWQSLSPGYRREIERQMKRDIADGSKKRWGQRP